MLLSSNWDLNQHVRIYLGIFYAVCGNLTVVVVNDFDSSYNLGKGREENESKFYMQSSAMCTERHKD